MQFFSGRTGFFVSFATVKKKLLQDRAALLFKNAARYFKAMKETPVCRDVHQCAAGTGFSVRTTKDEPADSRLNKGSGTHGARLQRDKKRAVVQIPRAAEFRGLTERDDLGVSCRVKVQAATIAPLTNDLSFLVYHNSPYRNVALARRKARQFKGTLHVIFVALRHLFFPPNRNIRKKGVPVRNSLF